MDDWERGEGEERFVKEGEKGRRRRWKEEQKEKESIGTIYNNSNSNMYNIIYNSIRYNIHHTSTSHQYETSNTSHQLKR